MTARETGAGTAHGPDSTTAGASHLVPAVSPVHDTHWFKAARWARRLAFLSLILVLAEGGVGLGEGVEAGSIALTAWALGSAPEAFGSLLVIWRFSGSRTVSDTAERRAQRGIALSFWLMAPYIAAESLHHLISQHDNHASVIGIAVTAAALLQMPLIGWAQHRLGTHLGSAATIGKGKQNYLCGAQAAAVLVGLALTRLWSGGWWLDPATGLCLAGIGFWQGFRSWRGQDCGC